MALNFNDYECDIKYVRAADFEDQRAQMVEEINNTPMTANERSEALTNVRVKIKEMVDNTNEAYHAEIRRLRGQFWVDCRADLGYDKLLNAQGVSALEARAYEKGHSSGYSEVYWELSELTDLAEEIIKHKK